LRLKIFKKLRTASLNSEFTGSYKKSVSLFNAERQAGKLWIPTVKVWLGQEMEPRFTDYESDALTTRYKIYPIFTDQSTN